MKQLTTLEEDIIQSIAISVPFSFHTCVNVYRRVKSFDQTISVLTIASQTGADLGIILKTMRV